MEYLFTKTNRLVLQQLAWARVLIAFDFDGTLAPIVSDRNRAAMRPLTSAWLKKLCRLYPCAVVSGRSVKDLRKCLGRLPKVRLIGNHGLEPGAKLGGYREVVAAVKPPLLLALAQFPGVEIEDKQYSLAIHYRRTREKRRACAAIEEWLQSSTWPFRVVRGKLVFNLVPEGAPHKGHAIERLRTETRSDIAMFIGDDLTDEDVFALDQPGRLLSIRVGRSSKSEASFYLRDQREIDKLLATLVTLRMRHEEPRT